MALRWRGRHRRQAGRYKGEDGGTGDQQRWLTLVAKVKLELGNDGDVMASDLVKEFHGGCRWLEKRQKIMASPLWQ